MRDPVRLLGDKELIDMMATFPAKVVARAQKKGLRRGAATMRTLLRRAAPRDSGNLRKAINIIPLPSSGNFAVGLTERYYYKTLEFPSAYGAPLHPFFEKTVEAHQAAILAMITEATEKALITEAGKVYARTSAASRSG